MPSPRVLKLADQIKGIVATMLERRVKDPRLGFVTITDVRLTGDSREATVFYTVLGGDADHAGTAAALQSATGLLRSQVGKQLGLKFTPTLAFVPDVVPDSARLLDEALAADPYKHDDEDEDDEGEDDESEDGGAGEHGTDQTAGEDVPDAAADPVR